MDKKAKQVKAARARAEEATLNRILCWIVGGVVLEFLLLLLDRYYSNYTVDQIELAVALRTAVKILAVAALACAAAAAYWWNNARKTDRGTGLPGLLCLFLLGVSVSCFVTWAFSSAGLHLMYLLIPGVIVLALVYYLYQREFFVIACQAALALLGVWVCERCLSTVNAPVAYAYGAVAALLVLAAALLCRKLQSGEGVGTWKGKKVRVFSKDAGYAFLYAGAVVTIGVLLAALLGVSAVFLYAVLVAWTLIMAVYYTVKLM